MFVRYISDEDILNNDFILNPLFNETFSRETIDTTYISTYMQIWNGVNSYKYKVLTDREGTIEYGTICSKELLSEITERFFGKGKVNYLKRNLPLCKNWDTIDSGSVNGMLDKLSESEIDTIIIDVFGENYAQSE